VRVEEREMSAIYGTCYGRLVRYLTFCLGQDHQLTVMLASSLAMVAGSTMDHESVGLVRDYVNELMT